MWSHRSEETAGVIVMVSDWLELDAVDSWVRHDSEIVSVLRRRKFLNPRYLSPPTWIFMAGCDFTRPYSRSFLTRLTWMCKP